MSKDDIAVKDEVVADTTAAESAPGENLESEIAEEDVDTSGYDEEGDLTTKPETEDEARESEQSDKTESSDETGGDKRLDGEKPLSPKAENRVQQAVNERNEALAEAERVKAELDSLRAREAQFAQEQNLINEVNPETGEYYTPQEIERIAWQQAREQQAQQVAQERYNLEVQQNQQTIDSELARAFQEFPELDPSNDTPLAKQAVERVVRALARAEDGTVVGAYDSPYEILKTIAEATKANAAQYEAKAQKATEKMLANVDPGTSATQAKAKTADDEMFAGYDEAI